MITDLESTLSEYTPAIGAHQTRSVIDAVYRSLSGRAAPQVSRRPLDAPHASGRDQMAKRLFLGYSHKDDRFVVRLALDLHAAGLDVWIDRWRLKPGDQLVRSVGQGIGTSHYFLPVLSPAFVRSRFARRELDEALVAQLGERRVKVIPILAKDCSVPRLLRSIIYADFRRSYTSGVESLAKALGVDLPSQPVTCLNEVATLAVVDRGRRFRTTHSRVIEVTRPGIRQFTELNVFHDKRPERIRVNSGQPRVESVTGLHRIVTALTRPLPVRRALRRTVSYEISGGPFDRDGSWFYRLQASFMWARIRVRFSPDCHHPSGNSSGGSAFRQQ